MTLRDVGDWLEGAAVAFGRDLQTVFSENILDWPLYLAILIPLFGLMLAFGLLEGFLGLIEAADKWYRRNVHEDGLKDALQLAVLSLIVWSALFAVALVVLMQFEAPSDALIVLFCVVLPTLATIMLLVLIFMGRAANRRERERQQRRRPD